MLPELFMAEKEVLARSCTAHFYTILKHEMKWGNS